MKKYIMKIVALFSMFMIISCSDMLETESERQIFDLNLNQKTDSLFFTYGLMNAMQQLADQYVIQNEMRGDLVSTTTYTNKYLRQMADYSATTTNKYDSAYVYYRVINNCNYYIAHRDTTLMTGSTNVVLNEYAAVKAYRAWAYLQLARLYGKVPFFTEPLTNISQINDNNYPQLDITGIVNQLAPDLEQYTGYDVPNYGTISCGSTNSGTAKTAQSKLCFIPVDVILGEMYLEIGAYAKAATHYYTFLYARKANESYNRASFSVSDGVTLPSDFTTYTGTWNSIFGNNPTNDIVTYIPMAVNKLKGTVTGLPILFGYDYYSTSTNFNAKRSYEVQIVPSDTYDLIADSADYYYQSSTNVLGTTVKSIKLGDMRKNIIEEGTKENISSRWIEKYDYANVVLYRISTIYLHLAEALNRLGYPDAAFLILKDGIKNKSIMDSTYVSAATKNLFTETYPFCSTANLSVFTTNYGIHGHGCGYVEGTFSPYQMDTIVGQKMKEIAEKFDVVVGTEKQDTINAVEDILCDEYAMESAFEGCRFSDLIRMARHKNNETLYGNNFGSIWFASKMAFKSPQKDLTIPSNWYLPFQ